jgi:hypothetical protein
MRRLRMTNRMLSVVLVAAGARAIISGPRSSLVIVGTVVALLLSPHCCLPARDRGSIRGHTPSRLHGE